MSRSKSAVPGHRRRRKIVAASRGRYGGRRRLYRTAIETSHKGLTYAYRDRRNRKRDFRSLWVTRLTAACRARGMRYSRFIFGLKAASVIINRKMLSEVAIHDPAGFDAVVEIAQAHQPAQAA